jgi:amino acid transporter
MNFFFPNVNLVLNICQLIVYNLSINYLYIIIQNKWHPGRRWKFKFTLAATPLLIIP